MVWQSKRKKLLLFSDCNTISYLLSSISYLFYFPSIAAPTIPASLPSLARASFGMGSALNI